MHNKPTNNKFIYMAIAITAVTIISTIIIVNSLDSDTRYDELDKRYGGQRMDFIQQEEIDAINNGDCKAFRDYLKNDDIFTISDDRNLTEEQRDKRVMMLLNCPSDPESGDTISELSEDQQKNNSIRELLTYQKTTGTTQLETKELEIKVEEKIKIDEITTNKERYRVGDEAIIITELTNSISEKVHIHVIDSENNVLHDEIIITDSFGIGTTKFLIPIYYGVDETIQIITTMVNYDFGQKIKKSVSIRAEPIMVKFTVDKERYSTGDEIIITATTSPPTEMTISTQISRCILTDFNGYEDDIITDSDGKGSVTSKIRAAALYDCPKYKDPITAEILVGNNLWTETKTTSESQEFIINPKSQG